MKENKKDSPEVVKQYAPNDVVEVIVVKEHDGLRKKDELLRPYKIAARMINLGFWKLK